MTDPMHHLQPRRDAEAAAEATGSAIMTTAGRALALGSALAASQALVGIQQDLADIGIDDVPGPWGGWEQRKQHILESDRVLSRFQVLHDVREREDGGWIPPENGDVIGRGPARMELWRSISARPTAPDCIAWLRLLLTDNEPIAAVAAAAALSHTRPPQEGEPPQTLARARVLLQHFERSPIPECQMIARAALGVGHVPSATSGAVKEIRDQGAQTVSMIVHGTFAWPQDWWHPGGDFHSYIREDIRQDLFGGGHYFSWSGRYKGKHRDIAARRFADWARSVAECDLNTVFAHSYGGVIALSSTRFGVRMREIVLLSTPAPNIPVEWRNIGRAVSLRIHLDLVLLAARERQRYTENVDEVYLPSWFIAHGDSHSPAIWEQNNCAAALRLVQDG